MMTVDEQIKMVEELEKLRLRIVGSSFEGFRKCMDNSGSKELFSQADVISSLLQRKDTLAVMPTSKGKTLCYQAAALCSEGITIVITPLRALCEDQIKKFNKNYCDIFLRDSETYKSYCDTEMGKLYDGILPMAAAPGMYGYYGDSFFDELVTSKNAGKEKGKKIVYKLLYLSPERLNRGKFYLSLMNAVKSGKIHINSVIVDEVHCLSQWSYDFRPSYLNLCNFLALYEKATGKRLLRAGFTATATQTDIKRIKTLLNMNDGQGKDADRFICREANEKIKISIRNIQQKEGLNGQKVSQGLDAGLKGCLLGEDRFEFKKCIVFCNKRKKVDELEEKVNSWLAKEGKTYKCAKYHAGMSEWERKNSDEAFRLSPNDKNAANILICTIAYGLGVDNSEVDLVINFGIPKTIEELWQELGRTGRGSKVGQAVILYKKNGPSVAGSMINMSRWALKWDVDFGAYSLLNNIKPAHKDVLILLKVYRFARLKEIIESGLVSNEDANNEIVSSVQEYFDEDILVPENAIRIKQSVVRLGQSVEAVYNESIANIEDKIEKTSVLRNINRLKKTRGKYARILEETKESIEKASSIAGQLNDNGNLYLQNHADGEWEVNSLDNVVAKQTREIQILRVNNTQVAHKLRVDKSIVLGTWQSFTEMERRIKKLGRIDRNDLEDYELLNKGIFNATLLIYANATTLRSGEDKIQQYIKKQLDLWQSETQNSAKKVDYVFLVGGRKKSGEQRFMLKSVYRLEEERVERLTKESLSKSNKEEIRSMKIIIETIEDGVVVNNLILPERKTLAECIHNWIEVGNVEIPSAFYIPARRKRNICFILNSNDDDIEKYMQDSFPEGCKTCDRIITYFDMVILDAIYTLFFNERRKIYLQDIWELMSGRNDISLPTGPTKNRIIASIEKMRRLNITIRDEAIDGFKPIKEMSGSFLELTKSDRGYKIERAPLIYEYAERLNGNIISINKNNLDMRKYDGTIKFLESKKDEKKNKEFVGIHMRWGSAEDDYFGLLPRTETGRMATVENALLFHYVLHRGAISRKTRAMQYINCDTVLDVLSGEISKKHTNKEYLCNVMYVVLHEDLKDYVKRKKLSIEIKKI